MYVNNRRVEERLKDELKILQDKFHTGHSLTVKHLPGQLRYSQYNKPLSGEIKGNLILIYEDDEARAIETLHHELIEFILFPLIKEYIEIINIQNKLLSQLLYKRREDIVEQLTNAMKKS